MTVRKAVIAVCAAAVLAAAVLLIRANYLQSLEQSREIYEQAEELVRNEAYDEAEALLTQVGEENYYKFDFRGLLMLCEAHQDYDKGDLPNAYKQLSQLELQSSDETVLSSWESFQEQVNTEYEAYQAESERLAELKTQVPYVGLAESDIENTALGESDGVKSVTKLVNGEKCEIHYYYFYKSGKKIFTAYCRDGEVYYVKDQRYTNSSGSSSSESKSSGSGSSSYSKSKSRTKADPYNVYQYDDPEEFYEDNYYDFDGFEDAEDYWDDAQ